MAWAAWSSAMMNNILGTLRFESQSPICAEPSDRQTVVMVRMMAFSLRSNWPCKSLLSEDPEEKLKIITAPASEI